ncbi:signal peptidase I [Candidatus Saccharibacteria bacterium]|nr:signal peptidase I [Candidatus Saccharibacteria bacterium]
MLAVYSVVAIAIYILFIVAWWKIFTKAGEKGWKSLIPIYNVYILCRIIDINFWIYVLAIPFGLGLLAGLVPALSIVAALYSLFLVIFIAIKLGDAFGKSTGFKVGLVLLSGIFYLILAFGDSKYVGKKTAAKN